ncbi:MAG: bifunctional acetate--CoA ligase family protein/GNAT family N-acetyltransferase [Syntrophorhabdales bacterium]
MKKLKTMFNPKTTALIGAAEKEGAVGRTVLQNLLRSKVVKMFPVNPNRKKVLNVDGYPDIASVPEHVDLAVIATPARTVPGIVEECGKAGVDGVVIISAGFKEIGEEGRTLEGEIEEIRKKYGMRILGPNCLGFARPTIGFNATFLKDDPPSGNIAFLSQSGALGGAIVDWAVDAGIGFSIFASVGSMLDIDFGDLIDFLGDDDATKSILIYMEGVGNARKFMSAARAFARRKPIIILKPGRHTESAKAARSHTGAMAGDDAVYDAAFKRVGVVRVREIAELFDAAEVLDSQRLPRGPRLAIVTGAGGPGVMATDALIDLGGELAMLSDESIKEINTFLPPYWSKANPVDVLGDAHVDSYAKALNTCLRDPMVDGGLVIYVPEESAPSDELATEVARLAKDTSKPVVTTWMGAKEVREGRKIFVQHNVPTYETPEEAVRAYVNMCKYRRNLDHLYETPAELPVHEPSDKQRLKTTIQEMLLKGRTLLNEEESKSLLVLYGIPATVPRFAKDAEAAVRIADRLGYPVAIKVVSPDISHKSDVGGVMLGLTSTAALKQAFETLLQTVGKRAPQAVIQGVAVQRMVKNVDYELILGAKRDKDFGSVILFGMGGTAAEFFKDFSIGLPPLNQTLAKMLMQETKVYKMLQGFRGKPPANFEKLEEILVSFSNLIVDFPEIAEIDINPLAIADGKAYALDARMVIDREYVEHKSRYPHLVIKPYPTRYSTSWKLPDGVEVLLRPIRPEDEPLEHELLASLSHETIRTRFFSSVRDFSHEWLILFCNIDYDRHVAIVAEITENGKRKIIGVGRLIMEPDFQSGEFAILVHDRYQGKGLGYKLVERLIEIGREKGLEEIVGEALTENEKMLKLARKLGFATQWVPGGTSKLTLKLKNTGNQ